MTSLILFDLGGVVLGSPLEGIAEYERNHEIPLGYVNVSIASQGPDGAFQRLERGILGLDQFYVQFRDELASPDQLGRYQAYLARKQRPPVHLSEPPVIDTVELFDCMMNKAGQVNTDMVHALFVLRGLGYSVAALTNNWALDDTRDSSSTKVLTPFFDQIFESCVIGLRKPDPRVYHYVLNQLGVRPTETLFLDDIGPNLKSAKSLGMQTLKVEIGRVPDALAKLETLLLQSRNDQPRRGPLLRPSCDPGLPPLRLCFAGKEVWAFGHAANPPLIVLTGHVRPDRLCEKYFCLCVDSEKIRSARDLDEFLVASGCHSRAPCVVGASDTGLVALYSQYPHAVMLVQSPQRDPGAQERLRHLPAIRCAQGVLICPQPPQQTQHVAGSLQCTPLRGGSVESTVDYILESQRHVLAATNPLGGFVGTVADGLSKL